MKRILITLLAVTVIIVFSAGCGGKATDEKVKNTVPVEGETVVLGSVSQSLSFDGDIFAEYEVKVFSKIPDRIEKFYVDEGDFVRKGQSLAKIYAETIKQGVRQAKAGLTVAKSQAANVAVEYQRAKRLYKESAMSKQQYDTIQTQFEAANAQMEQAESALISAESALNDATISAPISGVIGKRYFEEGDMASPAMPLFTVVQMDRVKIIVSATETDLGKLAIGQTAAITVRSYGEKKFIGKVTKISPVLDPMTRMATVEVIVGNPGHQLKPGMFARTKVTVGLLNDVIVLPRQAVLESTRLKRINNRDEVVKDYFVFVIENDKAVRRKLDVIYVSHVNLAVSAGVSVGEIFIRTGVNNVKDGSDVTIITREGDDNEND